VDVKESRHEKECAVKKMIIGFLSLLFVIAWRLSFAAPAPRSGFDEKTVADFYRGKTVRIVVGFSAGGGYDAYSRLIGRHLGKHIPGNPAIVVENMTGAGSIIAANHVYNAGSKDGTLIGNISGPIILEQLFNNPAVQFDLAKFRYVAVPVSETYLMIVTRKPGVSKFAEILGPKGKQVVIGAIPGSTVEHAPILVRDVLGANIRLVTGYKGTADVRLAIDSGEVGGFFNTWTSVKITSLDKLKSGEWLTLAQMGDRPIKDLPFPNIPAIAGITRNEEQRQLLSFGTSVPNQFGKVYVLAPGVPPERAAALEAAFMKALADKELLAEADKGRLEIGPLFSEEIHRLVAEFLGMSADVKAKLQKLIRPKK
jgi:tripartite-type tricarboxylate transporter receptor subunit TctC